MKYDQKASSLSKVPLHQTAVVQNHATNIPLPTVKNVNVTSPIHQLQKHLGNHRTTQSVRSGNLTNSSLTAGINNPLSPIQYKLGTEYTPSNLSALNLLNQYKAPLATYIQAVSNEVDKAQQLIMTRAFMNIPAVDGYMLALINNFNTATNTFIDYSLIGRQAGYWIESYVTKVVNISPGIGLQILYQAKRGGTRPDIIVQAQKGDPSSYKDLAWEDVAWLDITSNSAQSVDHILSKAGHWGKGVYAQELLYDPVKITSTDVIPVPAPNANLAELSKKAELFKKEKEKRQALLVQHYAQQLHFHTETIYSEVKEQAVMADFSSPTIYSKTIKKTPRPSPYNQRKGRERRKAALKVGSYKESVNKHDSKYAPSGRNNKYFKLSKQYFEDLTGQPNITREEIASFVLAWNSILARDKTSSMYKLDKQSLGVDQADSSGADGELIINQWLKL